MSRNQCMPFDSDVCVTRRVLRLKLNSLRRELHIQKASSSNLEALRSEVYSLQNELLQAYMCILEPSDGNAP